MKLTVQHLLHPKPSFVEPPTHETVEQWIDDLSHLSPEERAEVAAAAETLWSATTSQGMHAELHHLIQALHRFQLEAMQGAFVAKVRVVIAYEPEPSEIIPQERERERQLGKDVTQAVPPGSRLCRVAAMIDGRLAARDGRLPTRFHSRTSYKFRPAARARLFAVQT